MQPPSQTQTPTPSLSKPVTGIGLYREVAFEGSRRLTQRYSTSFSLGIKSLHPRFRDPIYGIYGFVRLADEIVDSFHGYDQAAMLERLTADTWEAIDTGLSTNPILHAFQDVVRTYKIPRDLIEAFLRSMEMDLHKDRYERHGYDDYIYGSAEVVGLMCLKVFCEGDEAEYEKLVAPARSLGAAFQKVNFLRDMKADYEDLGRVYFPGVDFGRFTDECKARIEAEIEKDFAHAYRGIQQLPEGSRFGVYLAYLYYRKLFAKIRSTPAARIREKRIRVSNPRKVLLLARSYVTNAAGLL
jgi:phytoene/squalene synthetase